MWNTFGESKDSIIRQYSADNFDIHSGLTPDDLKKECNTIFEQNLHFAKLKSEVMSYILENCRVEVCPDDIFADKMQHSDIIGDRLWKCDASKVRDCVIDSISDSRSLINAVAIDPMMDFGHLAPDWSFVMENGIPGIIDRLENYRIISENKDFYDNSLRVYRAIIKYMERLAECAIANKTEKGRFTARNLIELTKHAPETLAQGMQLTFVIYAVQTNLELSIVRSLGGLDRLYFRLYESDLQSGRYTEVQLREMVRYFFWRISCMKVAANMPFYICGTDKYGNDSTNEFTYVLLEEYEKLDIYDPKIHVMWHNNIDKCIVRKIIEMIKSGKSSFVFINTEAASDALRNIGITDEDAKKVIVYGCYETASEGEELPSTCAGLINMPKILEMFLHQGTDIIKNNVTEYKPAESYSSFSELYIGFKEYLKYCITVCMNTIKGYEYHYDKLFTAPILSATFSSCVESGSDIFSGGAKYNNTSIVCACLASTVDSLTAIKKLVYDKRLITLDELRDILSSDWKKRPDLHNLSLHECPKFANNNNESDSIAADICSYLADNVINGYKNGRGGIFRFGSFSIDWRFRFGAVTGALPDGHLNGEPLSKNMCATVGMDKNGVTSFLNSVLKIDATKIPDGYVADVVLHSSSTEGNEGTCAMEGLLLSFMVNGGFAIQFNVLSSEILKKAQITPERYKNLQIRRCGWNISFVNLSKAEQDEYIIS